MSVLDGLRSLLFVPADDPDRVARAYDRGADALILDLEDGVAPQAKEAARQTVVEALAAAPEQGRALVRVNPLRSEWGEADLRALAESDPLGIVVPKADSESIGPWGELGLPLLALVETSAGLRSAYELASRASVDALMLGAADLGVELRLRPRLDGLELLHARSTLVVDSAAARIRPPFDGVCLELRDLAPIEAEAGLARSLGFGGKACVHPAQVEVVNRVFSPSAAEVEDARLTVAAYEASVGKGRGAAAVGGRMVDLPVVARARMTLAAEPYGAITDEEDA